MSSTKAPGVFCLEGEWSEGGMEHRESVEPALRLLERLGEIRVVHRDVATQTDLQFYLDRWLGDRRRKFDVAFLGFHGASTTLSLGKEDVSFDDLQEMIDGRATDKTIYFGSCGVLATGEARLIEFCRSTGARAIAGYTKSVGWVESAAFEILLIPELVHSKQRKPLYDRMRRHYPDLTKRLGFRMATPDWASERFITE